MKRILFVDDENKILDGIRRMLHTDRHRWDLQFAVGGEAALEACEAAPFDIVISDMRMPGMDGATLLGHIRDRYPSTVRIVLSGFSDGGLSTRAVPVAHRFLAKPCDGTGLRSMIENVSILQDLFATAELRRIIGSIGELPSLSNTYTSLLQALGDENTSILQVAQIIEHDMGMSAKVLQLVNSAFFGLAQAVTTVQSAASFLGMETIKNLALASETFRLFVPDPRIPASACETIQRQTQSAAAIMTLLPVERKLRDVCVVSALLHDVGRLVLASKMPDQFCSVAARTEERGCQDFEAEEEILGISHAEIGAYLLGLWGMPTLAVEAIAHHHRPTRISHTEFDTSTAVYVADLLADDLEANPQGTEGVEIRESDRECLKALGVLEQFPEFRKLARQSSLKSERAASSSR